MNNTLLEVIDVGGPTFNQKILLNHFKAIDNAKYNVLMHYLRTEVKPAIKGEITKGKLRWRGIRHYTNIQAGKMTEWLEQRGKRITPKIVMQNVEGAIKFYIEPDKHEQK